MPHPPACPYEIARLAQEKALRQVSRRRALQGRQPPRRQLSLASGSATQRQGHAAEQRARDYLTRQGLRIIASNLRCRWGEIDLLALDDQVLVFVEVRERNALTHGSAAASVNRRKQLRLVRTAQYLLARLGRRLDMTITGHAPACRFDVLTFQGGHVRWIRQAFEA